VLDEGSLPATARKTGVKQVLIEREMSGDEGENFHWEAVDRDE